MTPTICAHICRKIIILGCLFHALCISAAAHSENCPSPISDIHTHEYFLQGASLAALSYKTPGQYRMSLEYQCLQGDAQSYDVFGQPVMLHDIEQELFYHAKACVEGNDDEGNGDDTEVRGCVKQADENNGREVKKEVLKRRIGGRRFEETHYRCTERNTDSSNFTMTMQWIEAHDEVSLLVRMGIVLVSAIEYTEDLRLIRLNSGDWKDEEWIGIAGTNPFSSQSFLTSILALQDRSCLLDLAVEVAGSFFKEKCENYPQSANFQGSIVGHSLGGMASEYIAMNGGIAFAMEECEASDNAIRVLSYNTIGWDSGAGGYSRAKYEWPGIYSIRVDGEVLQKTFPNRRYVGHLIEYKPPEGDCDLLCRHGINAVQRIIRMCQCCGGMEFSYRGPRYSP